MSQKAETRATGPRALRPMPAPRFHPKRFPGQLSESREPARVYLGDRNSWVYRANGLTDEERKKLAVLRAQLLLPLSVKENLLQLRTCGQRKAPASPKRIRFKLMIQRNWKVELQVSSFHSKDVQAEDLFDDLRGSEAISGDPELRQAVIGRALLQQLRERLRAAKQWTIVDACASFP